MGGNHSRKSKMDERSRSKDDSFADALNFKKYTKLGVVGRGGFGKVPSRLCRFGKSRPKKIRNCSR